MPRSAVIEPMALPSMDCHLPSSDISSDTTITSSEELGWKGGRTDILRFVVLLLPVFLTFWSNDLSFLDLAGNEKVFRFLLMQNTESHVNALGKR